MMTNFWYFFWLLYVKYFERILVDFNDESLPGRRSLHGILMHRGIRVKPHCWILAILPNGKAFGILADTAKRCEEIFQGNIMIIGFTAANGSCCQAGERAETRDTRHGDNNHRGHSNGRCVESVGKFKNQVLKDHLCCTTVTASTGNTKTSGSTTVTTGGTTISPYGNNPTSAGFLGCGYGSGSSRAGYCWLLCILVALLSKLQCHFLAQ